tara:strand:+ start:239 stop:916 length:678 start_codon:yes stop_codon:yes gene_type:complete
LNKKTTWISKTLNYEFHDSLLLDRALTHRSSSSINNERLEYLGDAVLGFVIADILFSERNSANEGELSRLRSALVNKNTLALIAKRIHIEDYLNLGAGEKKSGGFRRASILADTLEAIFGAIYLDGGFDSIKTVIKNVFSEIILDLPDVNELKDPKTRLQEFLLKKNNELPVYKTRKIEGKEHKRIFHVVCNIETLNMFAEGSGSSRRDAEQEAAAEILLKIGEH